MRRAIQAEGLSKSYWITVPGEGGRSKRVEKVVLRDLDFDVAEGEVFGIVGRNGAGKSTLLKILSRITAPTKGRVVVYGTVASLLEVGTGMHPEMTGRENIFLNGALLGMSKADIARRFDEIVEFAGVGEYIDTPIKRYSSGMKLRLAFAVAAHLSADVMIVDEVLAVGDAEFQAKCLGALQDGMRTGRTTLFVSHNMAAVENLCTRVAWLNDGVLAKVGPAEEVVREYLRGMVGSTGTTCVFPDADPTTDHLPVRFTKASVRGPVGAAIVQGDDVTVEVELQVRERIRGLQIQIMISTLEGQLICALSNGDYRAEWDLEPGHYTATARIGDVRLMPRSHKITLRSFVKWGAEIFQILPDVLTFQVNVSDVLGSGISLLADRGVTWMPVEYDLAPVEDPVAK